MSEQSNEKQTTDPHGGISASARTADAFSPESQCHQAAPSLGMYDPSVT